MTHLEGCFCFSLKDLPYHSTLFRFFIALFRESRVVRNTGYSDKTATYCFHSTTINWYIPKALLIKSQIGRSFAGTTKEFVYFRRALFASDNGQCSIVLSKIGFDIRVMIKFQWNTIDTAITQFFSVVRIRIGASKLIKIVHTCIVVFYHVILFSASFYLLIIILIIFKTILCK